MHNSVPVIFKTSGFLMAIGGLAAILVTVMSFISGLSAADSHTLLNIIASLLTFAAGGMGLVLGLLGAFGRISEKGMRRITGPAVIDIVLGVAGIIFSVINGILLPYLIVFIITGVLLPLFYILATAARA